MQQFLLILIETIVLVGCLLQLGRNFNLDKLTLSCMVCCETGVCLIGHTFKMERKYFVLDASNVLDYGLCRGRPAFLYLLIGILGEIHK